MQTSLGCALFFECVKLSCVYWMELKHTLNSRRRGGNFIVCCFPHSLTHKRNETKRKKKEKQGIAKLLEAENRAKDIIETARKGWRAKNFFSLLFFLFLLFLFISHAMNCRESGVTETVQVGDGCSNCRV